MPEHEQTPDKPKRSSPERSREPAPAQRDLLSPHIANLHQALGNRNVGRLLQSLKVQRQMKISSPDEPLEREAEKAADHVVTQQTTSQHTTGVSRKPEEEEDRERAKHETPPVSHGVHRKEGADAAGGTGVAEASVEQGIEAARSGGRALPPDTRHEMEHAFGADFSAVRVHTDPEAARLSNAVGARAFATGPNVFFGQNEFHPESKSGKHLIAHELTHTIQQGVSEPLHPSRSGVLNSSAKPSISRGVQAAPKVTAVVAPAEIGAGGSIEASATVAGGGAVTWSLVGAPAGVAIAPRGAKAKITATAASAALGGANFQAQANLTATPADTATSGNILLVGITNIAFTANPAFGNQPTFGGGAAAFPAGTADPNRNGYGGNTAQAAATTLPAGRPVTFTLQGGGAASGASVAQNVIAPATATGFMNVKAKDNATSTSVVKQLTVNPVPVKLTKLTTAAKKATAAVYGVQNALTFQSSDATPNPLTRVVGETITIQRDDFGIGQAINGGPNPAPVGGLSAPANAWFDNLISVVAPGAGVPGTGIVAGQDPMDVNNYVGPGVAAKLPRVWILRQGFHHRSWTGLQSDEFDNGVHRRSLVQAGAGAAFRTEQIFPGASAPVINDAYAGPPLITLSGVTATPANVAADGVSAAQVAVATTVPGRNVNWLAEGPIAITVPALGKAAPVATPATLQGGLKAGKFKISVQDSIFPNRQASGFVNMVAVKLNNATAAPQTIKAGILSTVVSVNANPGGRTLQPSVDVNAAAAGVTVANVPVAGAAALLAPRQVTVTRPAGFTGFVTVTLRDSVRLGASASIKVKFL